ncbi:MAG: AIPR family protein [Dehalococcoides mccartyi]|uniref:AIPR family protein n=1 Tax=Dehalococcoides mccartyi TaxID=61435 RepID=UPI0030F6D88C
MELKEFRKDYLENIKTVAAAENKGTTEAFVQVTCDNLVNGELFDDYEICYYIGIAKRKKYRVDAYSFDDYDKSMTLIIADFVGESDSTRLTQTDAVALFDRLRTIAKESLSGHLKDEVEISTPTYDLVDKLYMLKNELRKLKFYVITDKEMSGKIGSFNENMLDNIPCEYHVWDIIRLNRMLDEGDGHEPLEIVFDLLTPVGVPCLAASSVSIDHCQCYLCVLPGELLANIYDLYGSRLLEGNVRTFLSARGNVNKGIRRTILGNDKNLFFAYNNGIAGTASEIRIKDINGQPYITYIKNLQIVNGGQTTASLSNTRYKDKASLEGIFVQMKLTVIDDNGLASEIIPNISRCSNSQNKVSEADFFSNHEFNIRMQKISRRLFAPAALGVQYETHWFYERARGQYENEQSKMTAQQKKQFALMNPKSQLFDKTTLAKIENAWRGFPHIASAGAQKSFKKWAEIIVNEWDKNQNQFNDLYFKNLVSVLIIFRFLEKTIPKQNWYESGYRANIIVYSISFLNYIISKQFPGRVLDLNAIWVKQKMGEELERQMLDIAKHIFDFITDENRPVINVTEWCKRELCWEKCQAKHYILEDNIVSSLAYSDNVKIEECYEKKDRKIQTGIEYQIEVVSKGSEYWKEVTLFAREKKLLSEKEMSILQSAFEMDKGKIPSDKQSTVILSILEKVRDEGFTK